MNIIKIIKKNIFRKRKEGASSIGIIGGADGPTAILYAGKKSNKSDQEEFLKYAKSKIKPNYRSINQLENFLIENYKARPYQLSEKKLEMLKVNVIMNKYRDLLVFPQPLGENPTKKQILKYAQEDTSFDQAKDYPAEKLGLVMKAYKLPLNLDSQKDAMVQLEMTSEYISISDAPKDLADDLLIWLGVSEEDIDKETPRFIAYAYTLRHRGKI